MIDSPAPPRGAGFEPPTSWLRDPRAKPLGYLRHGLLVLSTWYHGPWAHGPMGPWVPKKAAHGCPWGPKAAVPARVPGPCSFWAPWASMGCLFWDPWTHGPMGPWAHGPWYQVLSTKSPKVQKSQNPKNTLRYPKYPPVSEIPSGTRNIPYYIPSYIPYIGPYIGPYRAL